jgi:hypothetical protein
MGTKRGQVARALGVPWLTLVSGGPPLFIALAVLARLRGGRRTRRAQGEAVQALSPLAEWLVVRLAVVRPDRVSLQLQVRPTAWRAHAPRPRGPAPPPQRPGRRPANRPRPARRPPDTQHWLSLLLWAFFCHRHQVNNAPPAPAHAAPAARREQQPERPPATQQAEEPEPEAAQQEEQVAEQQQEQGEQQEHSAAGAGADADAGADAGAGASAAPAAPGASEPAPGAEAGPDGADAAPRVDADAAPPRRAVTIATELPEQGAGRRARACPPCAMRRAPHAVRHLSPATPFPPTHPPRPCPTAERKRPKEMIDVLREVMKQKRKQERLRRLRDEHRGLVGGVPEGERAWGAAEGWGRRTSPQAQGPTACSAPIACAGSLNPGAPWYPLALPRRAAGGRARHRF